MSQRSVPARLLGCVRLLLAVGAGILAPGLSGEAKAQGFFEKLFGGPSQPPSAPNPYTYRLPPVAAPQSRGESRPPNPFMWRPEPEEARRGSFRTLCVRLCDGYYWPISYAVTRGRFWRDANRCKASCGTEAALFYHPVNGEPADMVDLSGRAYAKLPTAFTYRKRLVEGCKCRPEAWSASEIERHQRYAAAAAEEEMRRRASGLGPAIVAAGEPGAVASGPVPADTGTAAGDDDRPADPPRPPLPVAADRPASPSPATFRDRPRSESRAARRVRERPLARVATPARPPVPSGASSLGGPKGLTWPGDSR